MNKPKEEIKPCPCIEDSKAECNDESHCMDCHQSSEGMNDDGRCYECAFERSVMQADALYDSWKDGDL